MLKDVDLSQLTRDQLEQLKAQIRMARVVVKYKPLVKEICDLPPDKAKEILCNMAKDVEEKSIEGSWQKIVLNSIKSQMYS